MIRLQGRLCQPVRILRKNNALPSNINGRLAFVRTLAQLMIASGPHQAIINESISCRGGLMQTIGLQLAARTGFEGLAGSDLIRQLSLTGLRSVIGLLFEASSTVCSTPMQMRHTCTRKRRPPNADGGGMNRHRKRSFSEMRVRCSRSLQPDGRRGIGKSVSGEANGSSSMGQLGIISGTFQCHANRR